MVEYTMLDWRDKDDIQRLLITFESDAGDALTTALHYKYLLDFFDNNLSFINKAVGFWCEVITAFRYSMLMQMARLFDESKDAIGMKKVLNILEQSKYLPVIKKELERIKSEYANFHDLILEIRNLRDKIYAHNDRTVYKEWDGSADDPLDSPLWGQAEEILRWAKDSLYVIRGLCGDNVPLYFAPKNDIGNLLPES